MGNFVMGIEKIECRVGTATGFSHPTGLDFQLSNTYTTMVHLFYIR